MVNIPAQQTILAVLPAMEDRLSLRAILRGPNWKIRFARPRPSPSVDVVLTDARLPDGRTIADSLADDITAFNATLGGEIGPVGAVMGATAEGAAAATLARLPRSFLLAPGIGAQGATFASMAASFGAAARRALPAISRGILAKGPSVPALRDAIERAREEAFRVFEG